MLLALMFHIVSVVSLVKYHNKTQVFVGNFHVLNVTNEYCLAS